MNIKQRRDIKRRRAKKHRDLKIAREKQRMMSAEAVSQMMQYVKKMKEMPRNHASFFEWPDKSIKEIGITQDLFTILEEYSEDYLVNVMPGEDPPDVKVITSKGKTVGIEVTELVNQKAIEYQIKNDPRYYEEVVSWSKSSFNKKLSDIIFKKNILCENKGGNYDELSLLIFTDEPELDSDTIKSYLEGADLGSPKNFKNVYILTGYEPEKSGKVLIFVIT